MKRFRWMRQTSRAAVISATVTRVILQGVSVEAALELSLPHYSINPGAISQFEYKRLVKDSKAEFKRVEETRRDGTGRRRMRG